MHRRLTAQLVRAGVRGQRHVLRRGGLRAGGARLHQLADRAEVVVVVVVVVRLARGGRRLHRHVEQGLGAERGAWLAAAAALVRRPRPGARAAADRGRRLSRSSYGDGPGGRAAVRHLHVPVGRGGGGGPGGGGGRRLPGPHLHVPGVSRRHVHVLVHVATTGLHEPGRRGRASDYNLREKDL